MDRDTLILVAFCIFALLLGMRLKQRLGAWKKQKNEVKMNKNQRPKMAHAEEPAEVRAKRLRREKRIRRFTIVQLLVLLGLMIYMVPALIKDFMVPGRVDVSNLFLRCLIFIFTIYIFILGYIKVFGRKQKEEGSED